MADDSLFRNRVVLFVGGLVALVAVAAIAYIAGVKGIQNAPPGQQLRPGQSRMVRLPPRRFESWMLQCVRTPQNVQRCGLILQAVDSTKRRLMLRLTVLKTPKGPFMVALTPPNALLPQGFSLTPDKGKAITAPFTRCMPRACQAIIKLTDETISALGPAATAAVHFVAGTGHPVNFKIPTNGFAQGYAALQAAQPGPSAASAPAPDGSKPASTSGAAPDAPASIDATPDHGTQPNGGQN